jgi:hypothetical protein
MSKGFLSALAGIAMTLLGRYGPWDWPLWPGIVVFDAFVAPANVMAEGANSVRAAIVVLLFAVNVAAWAVVFRVALTLARHVSDCTRASRVGAVSAGDRGESR